MSLINFRLALLDQLLNFTWRQWSQLGVLGEMASEDKWIIDPEALLIFSLEIARYEPRLFDEILSWLKVNGERLDASRLRRLIPGKSVSLGRVLGATLQHTMQTVDSRKWAGLVRLCTQIYRKQPPADFQESLFIEKSGKPYPLLGKEQDPHFGIFYISRAAVSIQKETQPVPVNARTNLRFLLRSLFGIGGRAECLLYLLTHEGATPREVADAGGLFWLGVQQTLIDLSESGLVLKRSGEGKRKKKIEYWVSQKRWWEFIAFSGDEWTPSKWLNWTAIFSAISTVWQTVDQLSLGAESNYLKASKLHDSLEVLQHEFSRAGYDLPPLPSMAVSSDLYQHAALKFLGELFKVQTLSTTS